MRHSFYRKSLVIRHPQANLSAAENFLYLLKGNKYTPLEAEILDLMMILHAEHGGGNNSTFTMRLVSSAMTDTYSATAAAIGSLKGRLHGGANLQVLEMMTNIKKNVKNWNDKEEIKSYLMKILRKEAYDRSGKIYGIGHAVYTLSDPRAQLLKTKAIELAKAKGLEAELQLYLNIEELAPKALAEYKNGNVKPVCANVDFFSGFVYEAIEIPHELFTPMFAIARMSGWAAHRLEEMTFASRRIIRPAYKNILQGYLIFSLSWSRGSILMILSGFIMGDRMNTFGAGVQRLPNVPISVGSRFTKRPDSLSWKGDSVRTSLCYTGLRTARGGSGISIFPKG